MVIEGNLAETIKGFIARNEFYPRYHIIWYLTTTLSMFNETNKRMKTKFIAIVIWFVSLSVTSYLHKIVFSERESVDIVE